MNPNSRRKFVLFSVLLLLILLPTALTLQAQSSNVISLQPSSGAPGTTVTITDASGTNRGKLCFVSIGGQANAIGEMAGALTYIIPANLAPQTITFICTGGRDHQRTNTAPFVVTAAAIVVQPTDGDSDGLPDTRDNCPTAAGPVENGGCPVTVQADTDGDSILDASDACPLLAGIPANNGCPIPPSPTPQITPALVLPSLPTSGACVLASIDADPVNIRASASTQATIVGQLRPTSVAPVFAMTSTAEGEWYQIENGWVAGWVTRRGGDCSNLQQAGDSLNGNVELPPESAFPGFAGGVTVASGDIGGDSLQDCPNYAPMVAALPIFITLYIVGEPDPCAAAQAELDGLFLASAQQPSLNQDNFESCHGLKDFDFYLYFFNEFMDRLHAFAPATWQAVNDFLPTDTPCSFIYDLMEHGKLPSQVPDDHVAPFTAAYCMFGDMSHAWFNKTVDFINLIGFRRESIQQLKNEDDDNDVNDGCHLVASVRPVGVVYSANVELYQFLHNVCLVSAARAARDAIYEPVREALDAESQLNNCGGTSDMVNYPLPADLQPKLPSVAEGETCQGNFRLLATFNQTLGLEMLYRMLVSPNACELAWEYARDGYVAEISGLAAPDCVQGDTLVLTGTVNQQVVLNKQSSWYDKLTVLDRPFNQVCDWVTLPGQGDSFAPNPTSILGSDDIAIAPSATPLGFVIAPSPTPLGLVLLTTPVPPEAQPVTEEPQTADQPLPSQPEQPPSGDSAANGQSVGANETITVSGSQTESGGANELSLEDRAGAEAVFLATNAGGKIDGVYVITHVRHLARLALDALPSETLFGSYPLSLTDDGQYLTYFTRGNSPNTQQTRQITVVSDMNPAPDPHELEEIRLVYHKIEWTPTANGELMLNPADDQSITLNFAAGLSPAPAAPTFLPETGDEVLVLFENGMPGIYRLEFSADGNQALAHRLVENAAAPSVSRNGHFLAFERADVTGRNIYVMSLNSGEIHPITQQQGSECYAPQFGADSLSLFFTCQSGNEQKMFHYGILGITEIAVGIPNAANPVPGLTIGFITFDDGHTIYTSREDGSQALPLLTLDGLSASHIIWAQQPQTDSEAAKRFFNGFVSRFAAG